MNCKECTRPATKCHGGSYRTAYLDRSCVPTKKPPQGPTPECLPAMHRCGRERRKP
nr:MAG TPA: hypothetical protein [Caudoviricetes sp.]